MVLPVLQSLLTLGLLVAAVGFMAKRLWHIGVLINTGTRGEKTLADNPGERTRTMLAYTLGQKRLKEDAAAGLLHGVFLYGFLILGLGHFEVILEGLTAFLKAFDGRPSLYERVLPSGLNSLYHLSQDVLAAAVWPPASSPSSGASPATRRACFRDRRTARGSSGSSSSCTPASSSWWARRFC
jgi:hypothetical protein